MKRLALTSLLLVCLLLLSGCSTWRNLMSTLGFDVHQYASEETVAEYAADSEKAAEVLALVGQLTLQSPILSEFSGAEQAFIAYRDAVLNHLLSTAYARYTGNRKLLEAAEAAYPGYEFTSLIPEEDFESAMYGLFGGSWKITHASGVLFTYLGKAGGYTCTTHSLQSPVETELLLLEETEKTFRMRFRNRLGDEESPVYRALLIKRSDGTLYFKSLTREEA